MSKYTTQVRYICETEYGLEENIGATDINLIISETSEKVLGNFPLFDENYRNTLCSKIIAHYYTREIAYETVALWKFKINVKLKEIMPYYNQLYKSELLKFNPLYDVELSTTHTTNYTGKTNSEGENNEQTNRSANATNKSTGNSETDVHGNTTNNGTENISNKRKYSDTPQGSVNFSAENSNEWLTNFTDVNEKNNSNFNTNTDEKTTQKINNTDVNSVAENGDSTSKSKSKTNISNIEQYTENVMGKTSGISYSKLLNEFRQTFLNIDMQIIEELSTMFFGLY